MPRRVWTREEKIEIVVAAMESESRRAEIRRSYRLSDGTLQKWLAEARKSSEYWQKLPKLPQIRPEFRECEAYCLQALRAIVALAQRLMSDYAHKVTSFAEKHDFYCVYYLDDRRIAHLKLSPRNGGYDVDAILCKEPSSTLVEASRKLFRHLSSYAQELGNKWPRLETKCIRLSGRTFLLSTSTKCKRVPKALRHLARAREEIDWILTTVWPDPFVPHQVDEITIAFDSPIHTDDGTSTMLGYLVQRSSETSNNLRRIEGAQEFASDLLRALDGFAEYYSRFT